ncbi:MAG: methylated-DNA--[protein]-cysteine S-methyltransferase [Oscillospiraceae bacterium]|nr:methylated-DNA--[protein]-cysteine S-methyltransferase [Oscillospiraceae bacterium]
MLQYIETPVGLLKLTADQRKLRGVEIAVQRDEDERPNFVTEQTAAQLEEYFSGKRTDFTLFFLFSGTEFERLVWSKLSKIPYGRVVTYSELARAIGQPTACRAVANAVGRNPFLILLPCHRVVSKNGLGGFSAGLDAKRYLLTHEGVEISENTGFSEKYLFTFS